MLQQLSSWVVLWAFVTAFLAYQHRVHGCAAGWFGTQCQFMCHCQSKSCDNQGQCVPGRCADGYFGPGCQYVDLAFTWSRENTSDFLIDQNNSTCNDDDSAEMITISLTKQFRFSWIRLEVDNLVPVRYLDFIVVLDSSLDLCRNQRNFYASSSVVDVTCDATPLFTNLTIKGQIVLDVCSIYISGGRNVALKQKVNQSSTLGTYTANKAVDGVRKVKLKDNACASTSNSVNGERWHLMFTRPQLIYRVIVLTSIDHRKEGVNFDLMTTSEAGSRTNYYLNVTEQDGVCDINLSSQTPSTAVVIEQQPMAFLALCEVEVLGETLCPDGKYGLDCTLNCTCSSDQICNLVTGACSEGCPTTYGYECNIPCSPTCADSKCHQRSGDCLQCQRGFSGKLCTDVCPAGTFGEGCAFPCSEGCEGRLCNNVNGFCLKCVEGQQGLYCEDAEEDRFTLWVFVATLIILVSLAAMCVLFKGKEQEKNVVVEAAKRHSAGSAAKRQSAGNAGKRQSAGSAGKRQSLMGNAAKRQSMMWNAAKSQSMMHKGSTMAGMINAFGTEI